MPIPLFGLSRAHVELILATQIAARYERRSKRDKEYARIYELQYDTAVDTIRRYGPMLTELLERLEKMPTVTEDEVMTLVRGVQRYSERE